MTRLKFKKFPTIEYYLNRFNCFSECKYRRGNIRLTCISNSLYLNVMYDGKCLYLS